MKKNDGMYARDIKNNCNLCPSSSSTYLIISSFFHKILQNIPVDSTFRKSKTYKVLDFSTFYGLLRIHFANLLPIGA